MWARHRLLLPYTLAVLAAAVLLAPLIGVDDLASRTAIGFGVAAVAAMATTEYRVVAVTGEGRFLLNASRIRQVATSLNCRLDPDAAMLPVGGNVIATDWEVAGKRYTVAKSSEQAMHRIAATTR